MAQAISKKVATITKSELKKRGWTDAMITRFLPEPDETKPNPHYRHAADMKLYQVKRVVRIEKTKRFITASELAVKRKASAKVAVVTRKKNAPIRRKKYVDEVSISVEICDREQLIMLACESYNDRKTYCEAAFWDRRERAELRGEHWEAGNNFHWTEATLDSGKNFLDRICVNYVRHHLTTYDDHVDKLERMNGDGQFGRLKRRVLSVISESYPWLAEECERQKRGGIGHNEQL